MEDLNIGYMYIHTVDHLLKDWITFVSEYYVHMYVNEIGKDRFVLLH